MVGPIVGYRPPFAPLPASAAIRHSDESPCSAGLLVLGGRFVSPDVIDICYADGLSHCAQNAINLFNRAESGEVTDVYLTIFKPTVTGELEPLINREVHT
jgi:hypothetical protein